MVPRVSEDAESAGLRARGEEALGELAQALAENPVFSGALSRALGAGERVGTAQRQAIGALNLASSSDVTRLEQRLRSLSSRLESIEDSLDQLSGDVAALRSRLADAPPAVSGDQGSLGVSGSDPAG
jgi:uncharacterized coiled-coil protein SlyX